MDDEDELRQALAGDGDVFERACLAIELGRMLVERGRAGEAVAPLAIACRLTESHDAVAHWRAVIAMAHAQARLACPERARRWRDRARAIHARGLTAEDRTRLAELDALLASPPPPPPPPVHVSHATFGHGVVVARRDGRWRIRFDDGRERTIVADRLVVYSPNFDDANTVSRS